MIKNFFTHNWKIKLFCLLLAIGFWAYVSAVGVRVDNFPGGVPLELHNIPEGLVAITDTQNIDVSLVSEKKLWTKISEQSVIAYVNCSNLTEGTYELAVSVETKIAGIEINEYSPQKVLVRIEPKATKEVGVKIKIEGSAAEGKIASSPIINPDKVTLSGPKSVIDKIFDATAVIRLDGESDEIKKRVELVALDSEGNKINGIYFTPVDVEVTLPIVKIDATKNVGIKVKTEGQLSSGFWISSISTEPSMISIAGIFENLKNVNSIETKPINIDNNNSNFSKTIELDIPNGISILDNVSSISVNFQVEEISSSKEIQSKISYKNLANELKITDINPSNIKTVLSGSENVLKDIVADNILLTLDLGGFTGEGEYNIDLRNDMFSIPDGVSLQTYVPSSIKITLQKK